MSERGGDWSSAPCKREIQYRVSSFRVFGVFLTRNGGILKGEFAFDQHRPASLRIQTAD